MIGDAKDFLDQHKPATPLAFGFCMIDSNLCTVRHFHFGHLAVHIILLIASP